MSAIKVNQSQRETIEQCISILDNETRKDTERHKELGLKYKPFNARYWCNYSALNQSLYALIVGNEVVCTAQVKGSFLFALVTHPKHLRRGYAKELIKHIESDVGNLRLDIYPHNRASQALFESLGYKAKAITYAKN